MIGDVYERPGCFCQKVVAATGRIPRLDLSDSVPSRDVACTGIKEAPAWSAASWLIDVRCLAGGQDRGVTESVDAPSSAAIASAPSAQASPRSLRW